MRLRRLREPRYLVGAIVGAGYLYFTFFARMRARRAGVSRSRRGSAPPAAAVIAALQGAGPALVGVALLVVSALAWVLPFESGLLDFSAAEVQWLFPAPVTRRALLIHRMLRSQLGLLFSGAVMAIAVPSVSGSVRLRSGVAMWLLLSIGKVYFTGVSLSRARLASSARRVRRTAWLPLLVLGGAAALVARSLAGVMMAGSIAGAQDLLTRFGRATSSGTAGVVLAPFVAIARPFFTDGLTAYIVALAIAC